MMMMLKAIAAEEPLAGRGGPVKQVPMAEDHLQLPQQVTIGNICYLWPSNLS